MKYDEICKNEQIPHCSIHTLAFYELIYFKISSLLNFVKLHLCEILQYEYYKSFIQNNVAVPVSKLQHTQIEAI